MLTKLIHTQIEFNQTSEHLQSFHRLDLIVVYIKVPKFTKVSFLNVCKIGKAAYLVSILIISILLKLSSMRSGLLTRGSKLYI